MKIVDRTKDLIKSGGEWISSVELEVTIMACPKVLECSCFGIPNEKFLERPMAVVVPQEEYAKTLKVEEIYKFLEGKVERLFLIFDASCFEIANGNFNT